jgi:hypothetical protein
MIFSEKNHLIKGLDPVADAFAGTVTSDVVNMKGSGNVVFIVYKGVGTTGTSTVTVEACSDVTPSATSAVPFKYRAITSGDTPGALTDATSSGFATTAGSSQVYVIEVDNKALADSGYNYVRLKMVEVVDSPVVGAILVLLNQPRYGQSIQASAIV